MGKETRFQEGLGFPRESGFKNQLRPAPKRKLKFPGMEHESLSINSTVSLVTHDRPTLMGKMCPNLVHDAGFDFDLKIVAMRTQGFYGTNPSHRSKGVSAKFDAKSTAGLQAQNDDLLGRRRKSGNRKINRAGPGRGALIRLSDDGAIDLADFIRLPCLLEAQKFRFRLRERQQAARCRIQSVKKTRLQRFGAGDFGKVRKVGQSRGDRGVTLTGKKRDAGNTRRLV